MITEEDINQAYDDLEIARKALYIAIDKEATKKYILDSKEASAILAEEITGKNETERKAVRGKILSNEIIALDISEKDRRTAQFDFQVAEAEVERIKLIIRLLELSRL